MIESTMKRCFVCAVAIDINVSFFFIFFGWFLLGECRSSLSLAVTWPDRSCFVFVFFCLHLFDFSCLVSSPASRRARQVGQR